MQDNSLKNHYSPLPSILDSEPGDPDMWLCCFWEVDGWEERFWLEEAEEVEAVKLEITEQQMNISEGLKINAF